MTISIPEDQLCESFDPMMILPEKVDGIIEPDRANTSCCAPAYVYIEGTRGKRFLCDFHYVYERGITRSMTPSQWVDIEKIFIENFDAISETFPDSGDVDISNFEKCWCNAQGHVQVKYGEDDPTPRYYCNFHYRKTYYRYVSNGKLMSDTFTILDARDKFNINVSEEIIKLTKI